MQWQDFDGNWHDVEGWRGFAEGSGKLWWVAQKDFGTGPFRWIVESGPDGEILATSAPFTLPGEPNATLSVTVSAP